MVVYILANIYSYIINKTKENTLTRRERERYNIYISLNGISVLNRRAELKRQEQQLIAERKNEKLPLGPKEIVNIYMDIKGNGRTPKLTEKEIEERYPNLTPLDRDNIIEFVEKIQNDKFSANDLREMQETYAKIEWKNDKNIIHKLFRKY